MTFNKSFLLALSLFLVLPFVATAQWLKKPLRFVEPDSVVTWNYDGEGFKQLAQSIDSTSRPGVYRLTRNDVKRRTELLHAWNGRAAERNIVGGDGDALSDPQGLSAAAWTIQALRLFLMQGDASYMDVVERGFYNVTLRAAYNASLSSASLEKMQAARQLQSFSGMMYATSHKGDELYVNLYTNATGTVLLGKNRIGVDMITQMPLAGAVKIRFSGIAKSMPFTVRLRMPEWAGLRPNAPWRYEGADSLSTAIYVNGHEISPVKVDENGYVTINRKWKSLDEIYIDFPMQAQYVFPSSAPQRTKGQPILTASVLQYGPLVYLPNTSTRGCYFLPTQGLTMEEELSPHGFPVLRGTMYQAVGTPQDAAAPAVPFLALPYAEM